MKKLIKTASLYLVLMVYVTSAQGQNSEEVTLTTYYPAPNGTYSQLEANTSFLPPRLTAVELSNIEATTHAGSIAFNTTDNELYCHDGTAWQPIGSGVFSGGWVAVDCFSSTHPLGQAEAMGLMVVPHPDINCTYKLRRFAVDTGDRGYPWPSDLPFTYVAGVDPDLERYSDIIFMNDTSVATPHADFWA
jgi:hypothetical protein